MPTPELALPRAGEPDTENIAVLELEEIGRVRTGKENWQISFGRAELGVHAVDAVGTLRNPRFGRAAFEGLATGVDRCAKTTMDARNKEKRTEKTQQKIGHRYIFFKS